MGGQALRVKGGVNHPKTIMYLREIEQGLFTSLGCTSALRNAVVREGVMLRWKPGSLSEDDCISYIVSLRAQDEGFCNRLRAAIESGEESCPIGVITEPGTKSPRRYQLADALSVGPAVPTRQISHPIGGSTKPEALKPTANYRRPV